MSRSSKKETRERPVEFRALRKIFFIATEDSKYSNTFLQWVLIDKLRVHSKYIRIYPSDGGHSDPESVVQTAMDKATQDSFDKHHDQLWFVLDHDRWPQLERICGAINRKPGLYIADCRPSFEVWFLLYRDNWRELVLKCGNADDCRREMVKIYGFGKTSDCDLYERERFHEFTKALENAKTLDTDESSVIQRENGTRLYKLLNNVAIDMKRY